MYTCLALLSFNIAYANGLLPACPGCADMEKHEHGSHSLNTHEHKIQPAALHGAHDDHVSSSAAEHGASPQAPCMTCDNKCCINFYHNYMTAITLDIETQAAIFLNKHFYAPPRTKISSFIPAPVHPPPIVFFHQ